MNEYLFHYLCLVNIVQTMTTIALGIAEMVREIRILRNLHGTLDQFSRTVRPETGMVHRLVFQCGQPLELYHYCMSFYY